MSQKKKYIVLAVLALIVVITIAAIYFGNSKLNEANEAYEEDQEENLNSDVLEKESCYKTAIELYKAEDFQKAADLFDSLGNDYEDSQIYMALLNWRGYSVGSYDTSYELLLDNFNFEDTAETLLSYRPKTFLRGMWTTSDQEYYLYCESEDIARYNFCDNSSKGYFIEDGIFYAYNKNKKDFRDHPLFELKYVSPDEIEIKIIESGDILQMSRQEDYTIPALQQP